MPGRAFASPLFACVVAAGSLLCGANAAGDELVLASGARLRGTWLNPHERPRQSYAIETAQGARMTLDPALVVEAIRQPPALAEYRRLAPRVADTVEQQWKLAEWCRDHQLARERERHLRRVIELDPDHVPARRGLGYAELGGQWVKRRDVLVERGFVYHEGEWRLPQEIDLLEERRRVERTAKEWFEKLKRWRRQLSGDEAAEALASLQAIRDPLAISALTWALQHDKHRRLRLLYVEVLGKIDDPRSLQVLIATALSDGDAEVFHACLDWIGARQTPGVVRQLALVLQDGDNRRVNRAAMILGQLGDNAAIEPLIDALVTTHIVVAPNASGRSRDTVTYAFNNSSSSAGPAGASGTSLVQGNGPERILVRAANQDVLHALSQLTGVSFSFDQRTWRNWQWLHQRQRAEQLATLRDREP